MYSNFTFITNGELVPQIGIKRAVSNNAISLDTYKDFDNIRITATQNKIQYVLDIIEPNKILFDDFDQSEQSLISTIFYGAGGSVYSVINKKVSTASGRREDNSLKFDDAVDGHCAALHGMLRLMFNIIPPNDTILGHAHNLFTTLLYTLVMRVFGKDYSINQRNTSEDELACIRYACACISAKKHFELSCSVNDVAVPLTTLMFSRVRPITYQVLDGSIIDYSTFIQYIANKTILKNIDKSIFIEGVLRQLGYRGLVLLDCGIDFMLDCLLSKSINRIMSRGISKMILPQQYESLNRKVIQAYYMQRSLNVPR